MLYRCNLIQGSFFPKHRKVSPETPLWADLVLRHLMPNLNAGHSLHSMNLYYVTYKMFATLILCKFPNSCDCFNVGHPIVLYVHDQVARTLKHYLLNKLLWCHKCGRYNCVALCVVSSVYSCYCSLMMTYSESSQNALLLSKQLCVCDLNT